MRRSWLRPAAALLLPALAACDVGGDTRYMQFDWSAKVDGQPVAVSHVVECITEPAPTANPFDKPRRAYVPRQRNAFRDLPDGSRLYIEHGEICGRIIGHGAQPDDFDPDNFKPVVYRWFRTAGVPRIEVYYSDAYYTSPGARLTDARASVAQITDAPTAGGRTIAPCPDVDPVRTLAAQTCRTGSKVGRSSYHWHYAQRAQLDGAEPNDLREYLKRIAWIGWLSTEHQDIELIESPLRGPEIARIAASTRPLLAADDACGDGPKGPVGYLVLRLMPGHATPQQYCSAIEANSGRPGSATALNGPDVVVGNWVSAS